MPYIILTVFLLALILYACLKIRDSRYIRFLRKNSITLKNLNELNPKYNFAKAQNYVLKNTYDADFNYEGISCEDYLIYDLQFKKREVQDQLTILAKNARLYREYEHALDEINKIGTYREDIGKLKRARLIKIEENLINRTIKTADTTFHADVTLYRSDMSGRILARKHQTFDSEAIRHLIEKLNDKSGSFYRDKSIWDAIVRVERGKVSNKIRFAIYKKDGYRCRNCGVSGQSHDLEVDHIIPIAKGGKSTFNNLQTLCHRCNVAKGTSMPGESFGYRRR